MRNNLLHLVAASLSTLAATSLVACGSAPSDPSSGPAPSVEPAPAPSAGNGDTTSGTVTPPSDPVSPSSARAIMTTVVPAGVQCIVATVTGSTTETVSTSVAAGAASATINFGVLNAGAITVNASAYNTACPASGVPSWVGDPVQAFAVAGETTPIALVLHATATATGAVTFSQPAVSIAAGGFTTYAALADGTVRQWGNNSNCGTTVNATPTLVAGVTGAVQLAAGYGFACALRNDTSVVCWGDDINSLGFANFAGGIGAACSAPAVQPALYATHISAGISAYSYVGLGGSYGSYWKGFAWTGTSGAVEFVAPAQGYYDTCLLTQEGVSTCIAASTTTLSPVSQVFQGWEASATGPFGCAILANGSVECWGPNQYGELGDGTATSTIVAPTLIASLSNVATMALSNDTNGYAPSGYTSGTYSNVAHTCAALQNGNVLCAGNNLYGQLGDDSTTPSFTYVPAVGLTNVVGLAAGFIHTCALRADGSVACWGNNDFGQLGDGTTTTRFAPVNVTAW